MLLYNARIFGYEDAEYILIRDNKIEEIGKGNPPSDTREIDVNGHTILPGFCDTHTHLINIALMHSELDLVNKSRKEVLELVERECKKKKIIIGRGWDESFWNRKEYLTAEELDNICSSKIVFLIREDGHLGVLNSYGVRELGIGEEDGIVREKELEKVIKRLKIGESLNFEYAQWYALSKGVTCVHDFANLKTFREYMKLHRESKLKIRIYVNFYRSVYNYIKKMGFYSGYGDLFLRVGALKCFSDGSIGAKTAATKYVDGEVVKPMLRSRKLKKIVKDANANGIRVFTHAIGDYAITEVLRGYRKTKGNRIEHFELATPEHVSLLNEISLSMQPNFLKWAKKGGLYEEMLGEEWLSRNNSYRTILNEGATLLFGSDCMPLDPIFGIKMVLESEYPLQRISLREAINSYVLGAKYFGKKFGEIKEGNIADLVILNKDISNVKDLANVKVNMTIVDGMIRYTSQ